MSALTVAVAIPTYRREQVLLDTIAQVVAQRPAPDEVLVVDQSEAHEPATEERLRAWDAAGQIRWLRLARPNLPAARNAALLASRCDVVVFLDDDVILDPGFLAHHARHYADPNVTAVAGRVVQAHGWHRALAPKWPRLFDYYYYRMDSVTPEVGVAVFCGGNHSVRRACMLSAGGYDEQFIGGAYHEDSDAALRLWRAGEVIVYEPRASLLHLAWPAGGSRAALPEWIASYPATYFTMKHLLGTRRGWADLLALNVRRYVLRKDNVLHPWRLPWAAASYAYGVGRSAFTLARARLAAAHRGGRGGAGGGALGSPAPTRAEAR